MIQPGRLPVSPRPVPGEALSSWVARVGARYGITSHRFMASLLPDAGWDKHRTDYVLDHRPLPPGTVEALTIATGVPAETVAVLRLPAPEAGPGHSWPRRFGPVWCRACVAAALSERGEFHRRTEWVFGGSTICLEHQALLTGECPKCNQPCHPRPVRGRLRLWCGRCSACVDGIESPAPPFEHGALQGGTPVVLMTEAAGLLLTRFQADLLCAAHGDAPRGGWIPGADADRFLEAVRGLAFRIAGRPYPGKEGGLWHPGFDVPGGVVGALVLVAALLNATATACPDWPLREPLLLVTGGGRVCDYGELYTRLSHIPTAFMRRALPDCGRSRLLDALRSLVRQVDVSQGALWDQARQVLARR